MTVDFVWFFLSFSYICRQWCPHTLLFFGMEGQAHLWTYSLHTHTHTQSVCSSFRSIFTCTVRSAHGLENSINWEWDKWGQIITGSLAGMEVLRFMSMTCQVELSAVNDINQYSWQLQLQLLLNNSQLTPPICLTFTGFDTHTPDLGVQTDTHKHRYTHILCKDLGATHTHTPKCALYVNAEPLCWKWWVVCFRKKWIYILHQHRWRTAAMALPHQSGHAQRAHTYPIFSPLNTHEKHYV